MLLTWNNVWTTSTILGCRNHHKVKLRGINQICSAFKIIYFIMFYKSWMKHKLDVLSVKTERRYTKFHRRPNYLEQKQTYCLYEVFKSSEPLFSVLGMMRTLSKSKSPMASLKPILQAGISKNSSLNCAILTLFCRKHSLTFIL